MSSLAYAAPGGTGIRWQEDGASEDADRIRSRIAQAVAHILTGTSTGAVYHAGTESLSELEEEASTEDWDARGALPLDPASVLAAHRFLAILPSSFPAPFIAADPDGEVAFEWEGPSGELFSLSFAPEQTIAYAGIFGPARVKGIEYFGDDIPSAILEGLRRALAGR